MDINVQTFLQKERKGQKEQVSVTYTKSGVGKRSWKRKKEKGLFGKNISILQIHLQPHFYMYLTTSVFQTLFKKTQKGLFLFIWLIVMIDNR